MRGVGREITVSSSFEPLFMAMRYARHTLMFCKKSLDATDAFHQLPRLDR